MFVKLLSSFFICLILFFLTYKTQVSAAGPSQFVTIINPVRISSYNPDPVASLKAQYYEVAQRNLPATWLFTYDALLDQGLINTAKQMNALQEKGLFLEVTLKLAADAGVVYKQPDSWHRANALLLIGYSQEDRLKLIDHYFKTFYQQFGFYPTVTGAWWVDSFSLSHLEQKYNIKVNLGLADQHSTDGYQVWGQYWSTPYYPSAFHAGIPANDKSQKLDIVMLQWAARDPLNGYGEGNASIFSTQDYAVSGFSNDYFEDLYKLYALKHDNQFGQIVVGLEADLSPDTYKDLFAQQLDIIKKYSGSVQAVTATDFAKWYQSTFPDLSPAHFIQNKDLLGKDQQVFWYQSPNYRIGLKYDNQTKQSTVFDFRTYQNNIVEPYYYTKDYDLNLYSILPAIIDTALSSNQQWEIFKTPLQVVNAKADQISLTFNNQSIIFKPNKIHLRGLVSDLPPAIVNSKALDVEGDEDVNLTILPAWITGSAGYNYQNFIPEKPTFLRMRRGIIASGIITIGAIGFWWWLLRRQKTHSKRTLILIAPVLIIAGLIIYWVLKVDHRYYVSQSEVDSLNQLASLPAGNIIVYDRECLNCSWPSQYKPAVFANKRGYVNQLTDKPVVYNSKIFTTTSREEGKVELGRVKAKYIYLVRYGDYREEMPFSPGDYRIRKIYENAHTQVWETDR